jgi:hypothetical protein
MARQHVRSAGQYAASRFRAPQGADLDHEQDIESAQADRVEVEEVDCEQSGGLGAKEGSPGEVGSPWCRRQPSVGEDSADGTRANSIAQSDEFALDAAVSPAGVLPGQPHDQLTDLVADWWSPASLRIGPRADEKATMPGQQDARGADPMAPQLTRQHAGQCRKHRAVGPGRNWPADLAAQHH